MTVDARTSRSQRRLVRAGWIGLGCVAIGMGGVGVVLPGLPATVFFIVAAWAFARSSPRLERWVLELPKVGPTVQDFRDGVGMPKRAKTTAAAMIVLSVTVSAWLVNGWLLRFAILSAGVVGLVVVLFRVPTKPPTGPRP